MTTNRRVNIRAILDDPALRKELVVLQIMSAQEHEGRDADRAAAEAAYDRVRPPRRPTCRQELAAECEDVRREAWKKFKRKVD